MASNDAFLAVVAAVIAPQLASHPHENGSPRHWIVIEDAHGTEVAEVDESDPHAALRSFSDRGIDAAYVTHIPGPVERVIAYAITANPANSDLRQTTVQRAAGSVRLGPWEYVL
jgi:hypothetical protein